jgi:hypothetical protein
MTMAPDISTISPKPIAIGHNGGPPLDMSWTAWNWRRAHAEAWKSPGREIVLMRLRRAEQLGLDYRSYASVLLDRGTRLCGIVVMTSSPLLQRAEQISAKLTSLKDCSVIVSGDHPVLEGFRGASRDELTYAIKVAAASAGTSPGAFFMVSTQEADRRAAQNLGIGLFVDAFAYFKIGLSGSRPG